MHLLPVEARKNLMEVLEMQPQATDEGVRGPAPDWVAAMMPNRRHAEILKEIAKLQAEAEQLREESQAMESMGRLLWQAGQPLQEAVCEVFTSVGLEAERAPEHEPYDVIVGLGDGKRLLMEVTGLDGPVAKKLPKVRQTFDTAQDGASENDRIIFAANAYRERSVSDREWVDAINSDAMMILTGLGVVFITTITLFRIWSLSRENPEAAKEYLVRLHGASPGNFALEAKGSQTGQGQPEAGDQKHEGSPTFLKRLVGT